MSARAEQAYVAAPVYPGCNTGCYSGSTPAAAAGRMHGWPIRSSQYYYVNQGRPTAVRQLRTLPTIGKAPCPAGAAIATRPYRYGYEGGFEGRRGYGYGYRTHRDYGYSTRPSLRTATRPVAATGRLQHALRAPMACRGDYGYREAPLRPLLLIAC